MCVCICVYACVRALAFTIAFAFACKCTCRRKYTRVCITTQSLKKFSMPYDLKRQLPLLVSHKKRNESILIPDETNLK